MRRARESSHTSGPRNVGPARVLSLPTRAEEDLRLIRDTMARSATFTRISGRTVVALGLLGFAAFAIGHATGPIGWWISWVASGAIGFTGGLAGVEWKARQAGQSLASGAGRRFALGLLPPLAAAAILTVALASGGGESWVPGTWLLLYGVALISGGATAVPVVRILGATFVLVGSAALFLPDRGDAFLAVGFGGLHVIFGAWIWRRYGG